MKKYQSPFISHIVVILLTRQVIITSYILWCGGVDTKKRVCSELQYETNVPLLRSYIQIRNFFFSNITLKSLGYTLHLPEQKTFGKN